MLFFTAGAAVAISINHNISVITTGNTLLPAYSSQGIIFYCYKTVFWTLGETIAVQKEGK